MGNDFDILLRILLDQAAKGQTLQGIDQLERAFKDFNAEIEESKKRARELKSLSNDLGQAFRSSFLVGTAITGGIFAAANNYVKNAKEATAVTVSWKAAQESLNRSGSRFGAVFAQETLPLLQKAARLADIASGIAEKHPEIVQAALKSGVAIAALSAVGMAVTKGIRIYADAKYYAALIQEQIGFAQFSKAVDKFLIGTSQFAGAQGASGGASLLKAGPLAAILSGAALFTSIGRGAANFGAKQFGFESPEDFWKKMAQSLGLVKVKADEASGSLEHAAGSLGKRTMDRTTSPFPPELLKAYEDYKRADLELVQQHYADRQKVIADATAAERKANEDYASSVAKVRASTTRSLAEAAQQFAQSDAKAEQQNAQERARIIRDGGKEILQIEIDLQERLRKLRLEHDERTAELVAARDALGLVKEQRRFQQEQSETTRDANREIQQRRADIAQRLADLQQSYEQERAQRLAEYQARVAEIQASARQELAELQAQHQAELREIQLNKINRIREIDSQFAEERKRRYQYLIQEIRDLDAGLLGEKNLRAKYQAAMMTDLTNFLAAYRSRLASIGSSVPGRAVGGYASGLINTGERGYEYVLTHSTTRAAEAVIGGRLTQESMMSALMGATRGGTSVTWNDQRRFDAAYTNEMRRANREDTLQLLGQLFS